MAVEKFRPAAGCYFQVLEKDCAGTAITQADVASLKYTVYELGYGGSRTAVTGHTNVSCSVASCVLNTPATGAIVKKNVTATATLQSYFGVVCLGDASYATLKAAALKQAAGAKDLMNVKMDYAMKNICGINKVTVTLTADAIK